MQINEKLLQNYTNLIMPVGTIRAFYDNDDHSKFLNFEWERIAVNGNQPHNNLQPYLVVAYWRRIK